MCTVTVLKLAHCQRCAGKAASVGASSEANRLARPPPILSELGSLGGGSEAGAPGGAACGGGGGKGGGVGAWSEANRLARLPSIFWNGRSLSEGSKAASAASAACTSASTVCRSRAISQRSTTCTADSALALSFGEYGRAGRIETP